MKRPAAVAIWILLAASACTIGDHEYEPTIDAGPGRIELYPPSVNINEGGDTELTVFVQSPPMLPVDVACGAADPRLLVQPSELTFTVDRPPEQKLSLHAFQDLDAINESLMVTCSAPGFGNGLATADLFDDDDFEIVPTPDGSPPIVVTEAQSTTVSVRLGAQPPANVLITVGRAGSKISPTPLNLLFTPQTFDSPQNITVAGVHDADNTTDADMLTLTGNGLNPISVPFSVTDID